nr:hypothetical protein [Tanacetum cinerariifolium]
MTGNISYFSDYEPFDGGYLSFGQGGCKITGKGTIKTGKLEFENVYFVKDLKYNLFSVSQICDNKNSVLFTDSECIVLGRDFKLLDDANILLRTPRKHNMYFIDLNNIVPHRDLTCLVAKTSADKCILWHRRLVIDDFSRFTWTFFFKSKDETSGILKKFITEIENLKDIKVKIIRCDNGGEFKNKEMNDFCSQKGIKREFSNARTPQQNGVAERRNRTLIEAARTMVLVNKSHNKTPYELFNGRSPAIGFLKPFGSHVMILNTLDNLGKFEEKGDEGADSVTFNNAKQGKPACNGDDNVSPKRVDSSKVIMVNGGSLPKEDGSRVEKDVKNTGIRDKASAVGVVNDNVFPEVARSYVVSILDIYHFSNFDLYTIKCYC